MTNKGIATPSNETLVRGEPLKLYEDGKAASIWGLRRTRTDQFQQWLVGLLRNHGCQTVLDAACGSGLVEFTEELVGSVIYNSVTASARYEWSVHYRMSQYFYYTCWIENK